jgi:hypothetical protein
MVFTLLYMIHIMQYLMMRCLLKNLRQEGKNVMYGYTDNHSKHFQERELAWNWYAGNSGIPRNDQIPMKGIAPLFRQRLGTLPACRKRDGLATYILPKLLKAHQKLDKAVEAGYGRAFANDSERVAYLFELYQKLTGELFVDPKKRGKGRRVK